MPPAPVGDASDPQVQTHIEKTDDENTGTGLTTAQSLSLKTSDLENFDHSPPTALHRIAVPSGSLKLPPDEAAAIDQVFKHLNEGYQHSCIMKWESGGQARLYKWDAKMQPENGGKDIAVNLAFPSFLRIVSKTSHPYHGFLVDSATHREIFTKLGCKELPACVTAVPIKVNSRVWGALIATGDANMQRLEYLSQVEFAVDELAAAMTPIWKQSA
jgi:hypothetical protein